MEKIVLAINKTEAREVQKAIRENDGYCICSLEKTEDTKCLCKAFREQEVGTTCHCGLYKKV